MKGLLRRLGDYLGSSYWFIPAIMALGAVLLAIGMVALDTVVGSAWMDRQAWLYASRPNGARQVLSSIGGSMITVAGTVFSVTIAAVVYASGQYGPRLLTNFMRDRGNQVTLGTFIATFLYCLMVLRTIHSADEAAGDSFVPNLALLVGVVLALCSIAVLIFFIHHVPSKIHINSVIEDIGDRLLRGIDARFPRLMGNAPADETTARAAVPAVLEAGAAASARVHRVAGTETGYVQFVDDDALMRIAEEHDLVVRLQYQPGDFIHAGRTLAEAVPADRCVEATRRALRDAFSIGARRSALQDLRFLVDELVEIAARALSPGVNDPFTAVTCLDWLSAGCAELAARELPPPLRVDADGALRLIVHPVDFPALLDRSFGALAQYCAADMIAALHYLHALGGVALECGAAERVEAVLEQADRLEELARDKLTGINRRRVEERAVALREMMADPERRRELRDGTAWLGGTA